MLESSCCRMVRVCTVEHAGGQAHTKTRPPCPVVTGPFVPPQLSRLSPCQTPSGGFWPPVVRDRTVLPHPGQTGRQADSAPSVQHLEFLDASFYTCERTEGEDARQGTDHLRNAHILFQSVGRCPVGQVLRWLCNWQQKKWTTEAETRLQTRERLTLACTLIQSSKDG